MVRAAVWICAGDMVQRWAQAMSDAAEAEHELEADLARELALDPFEEVEIAHEDAFYCEMYYADAAPGWRQDRYPSSTERVMKRALVTGITGQDGSYLAELLLANGYDVHGLVRRGSTFNTERIEHLLPRLELHAGDVLDAHSVNRAVFLTQPQEVYHLAAPSHVAESFRTPRYALEVITTGTLSVLEAVRVLAPEARTYIASTSEMFGDAAPPQHEGTPFSPRSPYAAAKVAAHHLAGVYRDAYNLFVARGILFNHESERRLPTFVTRKITYGLARVKHGLQDVVRLGNVHARRDWGHAEDYVRAMWRMLQHPNPADFVIGTGNTYSVLDFVRAVASRLDLDPAVVVAHDFRYDRPLEVEHLRADTAQAYRALGWEPRVTFDELVARMTDHDLALLRGAS